MKPLPDHSCCRYPRRAFLADVGMGFTGLVLGAMLHRDGVARASEAEVAYRLPDGKPHFAPKAKSVIFLFMIGGTSQMESFDPKPELNKYAGKTIGETPYKGTLDSPFVKKNLREVIEGLHKVHPTVFPMQTGYKKRGQSGIEVSDWFPHVGDCIDDIAVVRSMWTTDNNHGAQIQFFTGRHSLEGYFPTIGSWCHYGLGALSDNVPQFVVLGTPLADCCGGAQSYSGNYLGPQHDGIRLNVDPKNPIPFAAPGKDVYRQEQLAQFELVNKLNGLSAVQYPDDPALRARIKSYELAFGMQTAIPEVLKLDVESDHIQKLYGLDKDVTKTFGQQCLAARRLVERGVRFVQIFHGYNTGAGAWDAHGGLKAGHSKLCQEVDQPIGALIADLKARGLLEDTLVLWAGEFGRTPTAQDKNGRDHNPHGFTVWLAGGGVKAGTSYGATDDYGYYAAQDKCHLHDLHATLLALLGLDHERLTYPYAGRDFRLTDVEGHVIRELFA